MFLLLIHPKEKAGHFRYRGREIFSRTLGNKIVADVRNEFLCCIWNFYRDSITSVNKILMRKDEIGMDSKEMSSGPTFSRMTVSCVREKIMPDQRCNYNLRRRKKIMCSERSNLYAGKERIQNKNKYSAVICYLFFLL